MTHPPQSPTGAPGPVDIAAHRQLREETQRERHATNLQEIEDGRRLLSVSVVLVLIAVLALAAAFEVIWS